MDGGDCPGPHCARMLNTSNSAGVCWTMMAISVGIPQDVALPNPDDWIPYAAQYATLPPIPAHLALPAPVWSFLSSVVLLYLQPTLLTALAKHLAWPTASDPALPNAIHFSGYSAGSYTAIALEAEYRLLSNRLHQPLYPAITR